jgi:hypothetical protein
MAPESINPFVGADLEEPWQQGFAVAFLTPNADHTPPAPLTPEAQDAFAKGATAGEVAFGQLSVPSTSFEEAGDWLKLLEVGKAAVEGGHAVIEMLTAEATAELTKAAVVARLALGGSLAVVLALVFGGVFTGEGEFMEVASGEAFRRVRENLASARFVDNLDLFMAVCDEQGHALGATDEILRNGFWHGKIFLDFEQAAAEGQQHDHPASVRVVHSQTVTPEGVEVIDIQ